MCVTQSKPCQAWHTLDNAVSHVHSLLWQKMQPALLEANEVQGSRERNAGTCWSEVGTGK